MDIIKQIRRPIAEDMEKYKLLFDSYLQHSDPLLHEVFLNISSRKGKMMRPMLTLLVIRLLGGVIDDKAMHTAATFEYFHTASLVHDDIVDESEQRRGVKSIHCSYGNKVAVLVGDYLLANGLLCASKVDSPRLVGIVSKAAQALASGEILQLSNVSNQSIDENVYYDIINRKTAALFSACSEAGALRASTDENVIQNMSLFGHYVGMCFQIRDDIFDYDTSADIGKPTGNDMKEGKLTLPLIYALNHSNDEYMQKLAHKVKSGEISDDEIDELVSFTRSNGGIEYAEHIMKTFADKAKDVLSSYPDGEIKSSLMMYVDYVIKRNL